MIRIIIGLLIGLAASAPSASSGDDWFARCGGLVAVTQYHDAHGSYLDAQRHANQPHMYVLVVRPGCAPIGAQTARGRRWSW